MNLTEVIFRLFKGAADILQTDILMLTHAGRDSNWTPATHGKDRQIKNIEGGWRIAEKNRDREKENGRSRDLSVMAMNTDKPTLWIMFLSLSALITVFLVKTNPLVSVHLQSARMFIANSWKKHTKRGCQGRQTHSHLYHCHLLWAAHRVENAGEKTERGRKTEKR